MTPFSDVVATSMMVIELQEQLLARERELDSREGTLMAREDDLVASECALSRARTECDTKHDRAEAAQQDYRARIHSFTVGCWRSFDFDQVLEGHHFLLFVQEADLE
jgi:hypothetical protein